MSLNLTSAPIACMLADTGSRLHALFATATAQAWLARDLVQSQAAVKRDRRIPAWQQAVLDLPDVDLRSSDLGGGVRLIAADSTPSERVALADALLRLGPWRKGPFEFFGLSLDAEWRSDWKWARVAPHVQPFAGRRVLDVGCGNGYFAWRMAGAGASLVLGLDPSVLALLQFIAVRRYLPQPPVFLLPLASAVLDRDLAEFDTVFSMGVLYHRHDPHQHLDELRRALRVGGELVLETLVLADGGKRELIPIGRYAGMRNVWSVPGLDLVPLWLADSGFTQTRLVDITRTTSAEQRRTQWMTGHSLADFLDSHDPGLTIEGYPAPTRAVFIATAT